MLTVNELFSGIGSQSAALERLGIDFKVIGIAEIDKYAIKSYEAIHGPVKNYGDISIIYKLDYADFWTYSFPCQDISVAGKQAGINENTRSGLLYEVERLLYKSIMYNEQPKYLMLENVKNLVGKRFKPQFDEWLKRLDELGYNTYWKVLNAKNYGIPQNRERVFAISIRKDIDTGYEFPIGFDNGKRLKDVLEKGVDEKFYLSNEKVNLFSKQGSVNPSGKGMNGNVCTNDICNTLTTNKGEGLKIAEPCINQVGMLDIKGNEQVRRVYAGDGISPTLNTMQGGNRQPKILIPQATKQGYIECNIPGVADLSFPDSKTIRGRVQENGEICPTLTAGTQDLCYLEPVCLNSKGGRKGIEGLQPSIQDRVYDSESISTAVTTTFMPSFTDNFRIRKLTPLECWRLMGFTDEQFHKAEQVNSNSQLYKQAGNSIVVDVLYYLFKNLFR